MTITLITGENESYFRPALGPAFLERKDTDIFIGALDDEGAAAAAAAFRESEGNLYLLKIGSDEAHRGKGFAYGILEEMKERCRAEGIKEIGTHIFFREGEEEGKWSAWLKRQGFTFADIPAKRYGLSLAELYEKMPFGKRPLRSTEEIRPKPEAVYGYELLSRKRPVATLLAEPFQENIYLSFVDAKAGHFADVRLLMDEALKNVQARVPEAKMLYMDVGGYRLMEYVERSLKLQGLEVKEVLDCRYAAVDLGGNDYE